MNHAYIAMAQAFFCAFLVYQIGFKFSRGNCKYRFIPSLVAACLASLWGQQWLHLIVRYVETGSWPMASPFNTMIYALLSYLAWRAKGNVVRMFDFGGSDWDGQERRRVAR